MLRSKLPNWERYFHDARNVDPLIREAVGHYQFEAIHAFTDGNGRTGRVLNNLFLIQEESLMMRMNNYRSLSPEQVTACDNPAGVRQLAALPGTSDGDQ